MKENKYDDEAFFLAYSRFPRSMEGLTAAGEWHTLQKMLPEMKGKRVLDVGCGYGWHCIYAAEQGAASVVGVDISEKMLAVAREKTASAAVSYQKMAMEDMDFERDSFDLVISSLAFHYTPDFLRVCNRIYRFLAPGGHFVFSVEHPVFTAQGRQDWLYDAEGKAICWPVDLYFSEGKREAVFLGQSITKYHRTLTTYVSGLLMSGFAITSIVEPQPPEDLLQTASGLSDEWRRPMMLLFSAQKG